MATHHTCDRCGKPIEAGRTVLKIESGALRKHHPEADLCEPCGADLARFLTTPADATRPVPIAR